MREDEIRLRIGGEVTLDLLSAALAQFTRALEAAEASHGASIRWVVTGLDHGSATALARAIPNDDRPRPSNVTKTARGRQSSAKPYRSCERASRSGRAVSAGQQLFAGALGVLRTVARSYISLKSLSSDSSTELTWVFRFG